jgi:hypothetical protein
MSKTNVIDSQKLNMLNDNLQSNNLNMNNNLDHEKLSIQIKSILNNILQNNEKPTKNNLNTYSQKFKLDLLSNVNDIINIKNIMDFLINNDENAHDNLRKSFQLNETFNIKSHIRLNAILKQHLLHNSTVFINELTKDILTNLENVINEIKMNVHYTNINKVSELVDNINNKLFTNNPNASKNSVLPTANSKTVLETQYCINYLNQFPKTESSEFIKNAVIKGLVSSSISSENIGNNKILENFSILSAIIGGGDKNETTTTSNTTSNTNIMNKTQIKDYTTIDEKIDRSTLIKNTTSLLTNVINNVTSSNQSSLAQLIESSNTFEMSNVGGDPSGDFIIGSINQTSTVTSKVDITSIQNISTKIQNDISKSITNTINNTLDTIKKSLVNNKGISQEGTNAGDIIKDIANVVNKGIDAVGGVLNTGINTMGKSMDNIVNVAGDVVKNILGPATSTNTTTNKTTNYNSTTTNDIDKQLKNTFNLDESFKSIQDNSISDDISNILSSSNIAKCSADIKSGNNVKFNNINKKNVKIDDINQESNVNAVMNCMFNQTILSEIATKIINNYEQNITNMAKHAIKTENNNINQKTVGDIYAAGIAGAAIISSAGEAGSKVIDSAGEAGKDIIDSAGSAASSMTMWFAIIGGLVLIAIVAIFYFFFASGGKVSVSDFAPYMAPSPPTPELTNYIPSVSDMTQTNMNMAQTM